MGNIKNILIKEIETKNTTYLEFKRNIFIVMFFLFYTISAFSQKEDISLWESNKTFIYKTNRNIKNKGLNISIKFPNNWTAKEGSRPNVIQSFFHNDKTDIQSIIIIKMFPKTPDKKEINEIQSLDQIKNLIPKGGMYLNSKSNLIIDGESAFVVEYYIERNAVNNVAGINLKMYSMLYTIIYKDYFIQIGFSVSNDPNDINIDLKSKFESYKLIFNQIINSVVILSKW